MKRIVYATFISLLLAAGLAAQNAPAGPPRFGRGQGPGRASGLKNALGLTDAQVTAIQALIQADQSQLQTLRTDINQKRQALNSQLAAASPTAVDVGNAAIALRASENKLKAERTSLLNQIKQQLTGDQQQKLDAILAANGGRGLRLPGLGFGRGGANPNAGSHGTGPQ